MLIIMAFTVVLIMAIYGVAVARTATREIGKINYKRLRVTHHTQTSLKINQHRI